MVEPKKNLGVGPLEIDKSQRHRINGNHSGVRAKQNKDAFNSKPPELDWKAPQEKENEHD